MKYFLYNPFKSVNSNLNVFTSVNNGVTNTHIILSHDPILNRHIFSKFLQYLLAP